MRRRRRRSRRGSSTGVQQERDGRCWVKLGSMVGRTGEGVEATLNRGGGVYETLTQAFWPGIKYSPGFLGQSMVGRDGFFSSMEFS